MLIAFALCLVVALCAPGVVAAAPEGQLTWAVHVTIAPTWFDPAETPGHDGSPVTVEDVKFSFERYRGTAAALLKAKVARVDIEGQRVRFVLKQNVRVRQQILHKIQQLIHERVMFAPIIEPAFLNGVGSRVAFHGLGAVANFPYSSPYEDLKIKAK